MFIDLIGNPIFFVLSILNSAIVSAVVTCWIKDGCQMPSFRFQLFRRYRVQKARHARRQAEPISQEMWSRIAQVSRHLSKRDQDRLRHWLQSQCRNGHKIHRHADLIRSVYSEPVTFQSWLRSIFAPAGLMATRPAFAFATI